MNASAVSDWLIDLSSLRRTDASRCGAKASTLGELLQLELPVPPGIVLCSDAFQVTIGAGTVEGQLRGLLQKADRESLARVAEQVRSIILECALPPGLPDALAARLAPAIRAGATFAVRSSGGLEDGIHRSWAGQFDTFLNVPGPDIPSFLRMCWASPFSPRALVYATSACVDPLAAGIAVIVQEFVDADLAGTVFTQHPVTQDPDVLVIEAAFGLGEALVGGKVTPDTYVVRKEDLTILERNLSRQRLKTVARLGGGTLLVETEPPDRQRAKLSEAQLRQIAEVSLVIEHHFGLPQDVEFCCRGPDLFVLQARPVTA